MRKLICFMLYVLTTGTAASSTQAQTHASGAAGGRSAPVVSGVSQTAPVSHELQQAYALAQAGRLPDAVNALQMLHKAHPSDFEVTELLGLVLAAEGQSDRAVEALRTAARLQPDSAAAHDNLATALARSGDVAGAQSEWQRTLALQPADAAATRNLASLYLQQNKLHEAVPLLRAAHAADPGALETTYNLALVDCLLGDLAESRQLTLALLQQKDAGEYHSLLGKLHEKAARYVDAANEFSTAAKLDPSEENLFLWGSELLLHRAYEPAIAVFAQASERFPASPRLWVGLGMARYSRGEYEPAVQALLKAADLNAEDPRCYLFLSKAYLSAPSETDAVIERFRRYASLQPNNAEAQYYYALSLWKGKRADTEAIDTQAVEQLFQRSLRLNDGSAETHLQLGIFYNDQRVYDKALTQFVRAEQLDPGLADVHFRLGRAYLRVGEKDKSEAEFARSKQLQAEHQAQVDKERAEVQQFVIAMKTPTAAAPQTKPE